jgi:hypothetical protein
MGVFTTKDSTMMNNKVQAAVSGDSRDAKYRDASYVLRPCQSDVRPLL